MCGVRIRVDAVVEVFLNMANPKKKSVWSTCFFAFFSLAGAIAESNIFPKAKYVNWNSTNFKTILTWGPKPSNYSYTIDFSGIGKDRERSPYCINIMETECDLTSYLKDLNETYSAYVLSEPIRGMASDQVEFPHIMSERFCPYKDTAIGRPDFSIGLKTENKITLEITDPLSAINKDGRLLNMREIFKEDLKYKVVYRKAQSSGRREEITNSNLIELNVDKGVSYCFHVQAYIQSRSPEKQLGEPSTTKCSQQGEKPVYEVYSIIVIAGCIITVIVVLCACITLTVVCCKRRKRARNQGKEGVPLKNV